jgi:hypothetical protein
MCVMSSGETLIYTTMEGQLMKMRLNTDREDQQVGLVSYLQEPQHYRAITGIAVCLKKPIILTSAEDMTLRTYSYATGFLRL